MTKCTGQNALDKMYQTKCTRQNVLDKIYQAKCIGQIVLDERGHKCSIKNLLTKTARNVQKFNASEDPTDVLQISQTHDRHNMCKSRSQSLEIPG